MYKIFGVCYYVKKILVFFVCFRFYSDGFKCTTKTAKCVIVNGRQVQGKMYIHWEFKISNDGATYTNDYKEDDY